jgi:hypothetical protein
MAAEFQSNINRDVVDVGLSSHHHLQLFLHPLPPQNADTWLHVPLPFLEGCGPVPFSSTEG